MLDKISFDVAGQISASRASRATHEAPDMLFGFLTPNGVTLGSESISPSQQ